MDLVIAVADPRAKDVRGLLEGHLAFCREVTPPGHVHAFDVEDFLDPAVTLFGARRDGVLVGVGALKRLDGQRAELKSMHTGEFSRGQGIGRALLCHLLAFAVDHGFRNVSLETGTMEAFTPARTLYAKAGFVPCEPFGPYADNPNSACMTIGLKPVSPEAAGSRSVG